MSYPYPQNRSRAQQTEGDIEYVEARQKMASVDELEDTTVETTGGPSDRDEPTVADIEENLEEAAREVHRSLSEETDERS